jgi:hypothetical protein
MRLTKGQMRAHIMALLEKYDINVEWCDRPSRAWGSHIAELICIAPIRSAISYATALHEIGHIRGRHQRSADPMVRERWAWRWARANAMAWTAAMERDARMALAYATRQHEAKG